MESGQALIIIAFAFIGIAAFVGLAIDLGILIIQQAHLRRTVDSASLAAATQVREGQTLDKIAEFAIEFVRLNGLIPDGVDPDTIVRVSTCTPSRPEYHDPTLCKTPPRKLIKVWAQLPVQFTFLPIIGLNQTTLVAEATSEAASVDLVLVLGTNETMGRDTPGYGGDFNPGSIASGTGCNGQAGPQATKNPNTATGKCRPLWDAKQAAKVVLDRLFRDADRVAIVTYDFGARPQPINSTEVFHVMSNADVNAVDGVSDSTGAYAAIDSIELFNATNNSDLPVTSNQLGQYSPINRYCLNSNPGSADCNNGLNGRNPNGLDAPVPNSLCVGCGIRRAAELLKTYGRPESVWIIIFLSDGDTNMSDLPSTLPVGTSDPALTATRPNGFCPGGILDNTGTPQVEQAWGLWNAPLCGMGGFDDGVGYVTVTVTFGGLPYSYPAKKPSVPNPFLRSCGPYHPSAAACPPGTVYVGPQGLTTTVPVSRTIIEDGILRPITVAQTVTVDATGQAALYYSAVDYARDMIDIAALQIRCVDAGCTPNPLYNSQEAHNVPGVSNRLAGANITIFTVGLGELFVVGPDYSGVRLLRYMAAVGDDGNRATDPCLAAPGTPVDWQARNCGNYYYARNPRDLIPVFEEIAKRIFTRITQ